MISLKQQKNICLFWKIYSTLFLSGFNKKRKKNEENYEKDVFQNENTRSRNPIPLNVILKP